MRITTRSNLAMRVLMFCASNPGRLATKDEIAATCACSSNHLGHVINLLGHLGLLITMRGRSGGVALARAPTRISVGEVFRALGSDASLAECFGEDGGACPLTECCLLRDALRAAEAAFYKKLDDVTLADLVEDNTALLALMRHERGVGNLCVRA